jgi:hypothetical protein
MSTREFFGHCLPYNFIFVYNKQTISVTNWEADCKDKPSHWHKLVDTITLNTVTREITGGGQPTKQVVNRAKSKEARAKYKPFLDWAKSYMVTLGLEVPKESSMDYVLKAEFIHNPSVIPEDRYLDVLSSLVYQRWYAAKSYDDVKKQLFKEGTHYDIINLPAGTLHQG